ALNNRYLKVSLRASEPYRLLESDVEKVIRRFVRRGTLQVHLHVRRRADPQDFQVNAVALRSYLRQLRELSADLGDQQGFVLSQLLMLPGVVPEPGSDASYLEADWPTIEKVLVRGLEKLQTMRQDEGRAMSQELLALRDVIGG